MEKLKKLTTKEEINEFAHAKKLIVYNNFQQVRNLDPEEDWREDNGVQHEGFNQYRNYEGDDIYELPNGYYVSVDEFNGTITVFRKETMVTSIKEVEEIMDKNLHVQGIPIKYDNQNDNSLFIRNTKVTLPISENELNKVFKANAPWLQYGKSAYKSVYQKQN